MYAKHYENPTMLSKVTAKNVEDVFLRHTVDLFCNNGFTVEDILIKSCETAKVVELHACVRCVLRKDVMSVGLKTLTQKIDKTSTIK